MEFGGSVEIAAPRERVWAFVNDPQQVGMCGPGVKSVEVADEDRFTALLNISIGPLGFKFSVEAEFSEREPLERSTVRAQARAPGTIVDGNATMTLRDADGAGATVMDWQADVHFSGRIASLGARLIQSTAEKLIGQTFSCIKASLEE